MEELINEIVKDITNLSGKHNFQTIFSDWVTMMAIAIQNCCSKHNEIWKAREEKYFSIVKKYTQEEIKNIFSMYPKLVNAFEHELRDYLGEIFMRLATAANKKIMGQCFTPFSISLSATKISCDNIKEGKPFNIYEPTCGSGGMIIASARVLTEKGKNYQEYMNVIAQDLDNLCVYMTYVQLSIIGVNAMVVQGDTLEEPYTEIPEDRVFRTPKNLRAF